MTPLVERLRDWADDAETHGSPTVPVSPKTLREAAVCIEELEAEVAALREDAERVELGCAGHFIAAAGCAWRRHTQVGKFRISSVGDYRPRNGKRELIGATGYYETMVFALTDRQAEGNEGCGCREVANWTEIDGERYETAGEAQAGHERYVAKYAAIDAARGK